MLHEMRKFILLSVALAIALFITPPVAQALAAEINSDKAALDALQKILERQDILSPGDELEYLGTQADINGEQCFEFILQFNGLNTLIERGRYAVSPSGKIYELTDDKYVSISKSQTQSNNSNINNNSNNSNLDASEPESDKAEAEEEDVSQLVKDIQQFMSIKGTRVNLREKPDIESETLLRLDEGTPVEVLEISERGGEFWLYVRIDSSQEGWIRSDLVRARLGDKGSHGGKYMAIKGSYVNVRSKPNKKSESVAKLFDGHIVEVIKRGKSWTQVYTLNGESGYVSNDYIRPRKKF